MQRQRARSLLMKIDPSSRGVLEKEGEERGGDRRRERSHTLICTGNVPSLYMKIDVSRSCSICIEEGG